MVTILTDLSWLANGRPWPPSDNDEFNRLAEHRRNRAIFNGQHDLIFSKYAQFLKDRALSEKKLVIILDWPRNATSKLLSLTTGDAPDITIDGNEDLDDIIHCLPDTLNEASTDWSRYGLGVFELSKNPDETPRIEAWNPENIFIVCKKGDIRTVQAYVLHYYFVVDSRTYLKVKIHYTGRIVHQLYEIVDAKPEKQNPTISGVYANTYGSAANPQAPGTAQLKQVIMSGNLRGPLPLESFFPDSGMTGTEWEEDLGLEGFAVFVMNNMLTTERYYGRSDYGPDVQSLLESLELAFARRQLTLATFSQPTPIVPESACTYDHALQRYSYKPGEAIIESGEGESSSARMLVWDAQMPAVNSQIEDLMNQLIVMLDLSHELLAEKNTGKAPSGTALRIRLLPTLAKVKRLRSALDKVVPELLSAASEISGNGPVDEDAVNIAWKDGIPEDPLEVANGRSINASMISGLMLARIIDQGTALKLAVDLGVMQLESPDVDTETAIANILQITQNTVGGGIIGGQVDSKSNQKAWSFEKGAGGQGGGNNPSQGPAEGGNKGRPPGKAG